MRQRDVCAEPWDGGVHAVPSRLILACHWLKGFFELHPLPSELVLVDPRVDRVHGVPHRDVRTDGRRNSVVGLCERVYKPSDPAAHVAAIFRVSSGQVFGYLFDEQNDQLRFMRCWQVQRGELRSSRQ